MVYPYRYFKQEKPYKAVYAMIFGMVVLCAVGILAGSIGVNILAKPGKEMFVDVKNAAGEKSKIVTYGMWKPSMCFYTEGCFTRYRFKMDDHFADLRDELAKPDEPPIYVISRTRLKDKLQQMPAFVEIKQYGGYYLGGNAAAKKEFEGKKKSGCSSCKGCSGK